MPSPSLDCSSLAYARKHVGLVGNVTKQDILDRRRQAHADVGGGAAAVGGEGDENSLGTADAAAVANGRGIAAEPAADAKRHEVHRLAYHVRH